MISGNSSSFIMDDEKPVTVSELTHQIKGAIEPLFRNIFLQAEISNFKQQSSGHLYFSLKDAGAQIGAVMFRSSASSLQRIPKEGDHVTVRAELNIYPPRGNYQLIVRELSYIGVGELLLKLEQLKIELHKRGWFSNKQKKSLPKMPRKIGIVTSPTGAAIQDMLNVLGRRFSGVHVILNPVRVQGDEAAKEIAQAIRDFNKHNLVDVMIVGRGGGSIEDLWAFNEEIVARAIFESEIPIIGAVGHETDHSIAEYVADVRAPTPSAAAEIVIEEKAAQLQKLLLSEKRLCQTVQHLINQGKERLEGYKRQPILTDPYVLLGGWIQLIDDFREDTESYILQQVKHLKLRLDSFQREAKALNPANQIVQLKKQLTSLVERLFDCYRQFFRSKKERLSSVKQTLEAIDPKNLLKNGYSILFAEKDNSVVTSVETLSESDAIRILVSDGEILGEVKGVSKKK